MKNVLLKLNLAFLIVSLLIYIFPIYSKVYAATTLDEIISKGDDFISIGEDDEMIDQNDLQELSKFISGVLLSVAIGVTIITGAIMGIKFITQSVEDKAKIKESLVPWIIGIIVSFGAFTIWEVAINIFSNI